MLVAQLPQVGNSAKFRVVVKKRGEFIIALSFTLRSKVWKLADAEDELAAAEQLAQAIVSRHDPTLPFKEKYIFGEHNAEPTLEGMVNFLRRTQI